jgi:hypothetical protein
MKEDRVCFRLDFKCSFGFWSFAENVMKKIKKSFSMRAVLLDLMETRNNGFK